jgi:hypothetical protein
VASRWLEFITANHCTVRDTSQGTFPWYRILFFLHALNDLNQSIREANYVCYTKQAPAPTDQDVGGPQEQSWEFGDGKNLLPLPGIKPQLSQQFSPITTVAELSQTLVLYKIVYLYMLCRHTQQHRYASTHLTSALDGGKRSASVLSSSTPRKGTPGTYWIRGLVGRNITCFSWFLNLCHLSQQHRTTFPGYNIEKIHILYTISWLHACLLCKPIKQLSAGSVNHKMSLWTSHPYSEVNRSVVPVRSDHLVQTHNQLRKWQLSQSTAPAEVLP